VVTARLVLLLAFATTTPPGVLLQDTSNLKLDRRVPPASRHSYEHIRDAKEWRNPYLIVLKEGVEVRAGSSRTVVPVSQLRGVLVRLPRAAWPYGRVVAVQEISLRAVEGVHDTAIKANVKAVAATLDALGVVVSYWPG
jgi:hypothetical protein